MSCRNAEKSNMNDIEKAEDDQKGEENKVGKEEKEDITIRVC